MTAGEDDSDANDGSTSRVDFLGVDGCTVSPDSDDSSPPLSFPGVVFAAVLGAALFPLTFLDDAAEFVALFLALPNQCGKPCLRLNPPGGSLSSSVALTVSVVSADPVVKVYVVNGTSSGWNISVAKVTSGGKSG